MSVLHIYRASAGSGKTFTLTRKYLEKALADPPNFSRIAALTFTNKATAEMKARIFSALNRLAQGTEPAHGPYLCETLKLTPGEIQSRADLLRREILANYKDFTVTTLDKFFQRILRSFAREINVDSGYEPELDYGRVMDEIVDRITEELRPGMPLTDWISEYLVDKLEEGKSRDFRSVIRGLGMKIFDEDFRAIAHEIEQMGDTYTSLRDFRDELQRHKKAIEEEIAGIAAEALRIMERYDLAAEDFKGGGNSPFKKMAHWAKGQVLFSSPTPSPTFIKLQDGPEGWSTKTSPKKENIQAAYANGLHTCVERIVRFYEEKETLYRSLLAASKNLFVFGIFSELVKKLENYREENNVLLLSDAVDLLRDLTSMDDAPFVYEKTGTRYDTYLLDEFQDTSGFQWDCTAPLVHNTLSEGHDNLVVGDPKQSIYRWRGGNRELINSEVPRQFPNHEIHHLTRNYRSQKHVIGFNNAVFSLLPELVFAQLEQESGNPPEIAEGIGLLRASYADVVQQWNDDRPGGYVEVRFFDREEISDDEAETAPVDRALIETVKALQDRGFAAKDIAVLVRKNAEAKRAADILQGEKWRNPDSPYVFDILSDEASYLENSSALCLLIHLAQFMLTPHDAVNNSGLLLEWNSLQTAPADRQELLLKARHPEEIRELLPPPFVQKETELLRKAPGQLFDSLIHLFGLDTRTDEFSYLAAFRDLVTDFSAGHEPDLASFLDYWYEKGRRQSVKAPDDAEAIRIMTFHKCKGLEFEAVIIPFFAEKTDHGSTHSVPLWVRPDRAPFDRLPYFPVNYGSGLKQTLFAETYFRERTEAVSDGLNLTYVAFTRAKTELHVFALKPREGAGVSATSDLAYWLHRIATDRPVLPAGDGFVNIHPADTSEEIRLRAGEPQPFVREEKTADRSTEKISLTAYPGTESGDRLRLKLRENPAFYDATRRKGHLLSLLLEQLRRPDEAALLTDRLIAGGHFPPEAKTETLNSLHALLADADLRNLFSAEALPKTDSSVIDNDGLPYTPGRVVLLPDGLLAANFKNGPKDPKDAPRMRAWLDLLRDMGQENARGLLVYTATGEIEKLHT